MGVVKRKRKGKPYQATVWVSGVRVAIQSFETRSAAYSWHDATKRRFEGGHGPAGELTLGQLMAAYRATGMELLREGSKARFHNILSLLETSPVTGVPMAGFGGAQVDQLLDWLIQHPRAKTPSRKSFASEIRMLVSLFGFYRDHYDERFISVVTRRHMKRAYYKGPLERKRRDFFMTAADACGWFRALARHHDPVYLDLARFQVIMGTRIGETAALCWDVVDLERGTVEIRRNMAWRDAQGVSCRQIENHVKTPSSRRTLPLPRQVADLLRAARARHPTSLVVFRTVRGEMVSYMTTSNAYTAAFKAAGLPWKSTHICRNTNATLGISEARAEAVQISLGHSSVRQTEVYARAHASVENTVPRAVAALLELGKK